MLFDKPNLNIGIDFDNTIVDYGSIFAKIAFSLGYLAFNENMTKNEVKKIIKESDDGERKWGILQSEVYSKGIYQAETMDGFSNFVCECRDRQINLSVISHKSSSNPHDPLNRDLKKPALDWMKCHNFFVKGAYGFSLNQVFFEETVEDKLAKIKKLNCTHFIDDLLKVLTHPFFPKNTQKILFLKRPLEIKEKSIDYEGDWRIITNYLILGKFHAA